MMKTVTLTIRNPVIKSVTEHGTTVLTIDLDKGWGSVVSELVKTACEISGQPELIESLNDILTAENPDYKIEPYTSYDEC